MSADYDRLFHSSGDAVQTADDEADRDAARQRVAAPMPTGGPGRSEVTPPAMPVAPSTDSGRTGAAAAPD